MSRVFASRAFRLLWLANLLSLTGSQASRIALILAVAQRTNQPSAIAALVVLNTLPGALLAPVAGAVIDRADRRRVVVNADLVRAAALAAIVIVPSLPVMLLMAVVHSIASAFFHPARVAMVPLVMSREDIVAANGYDHAAANVVMIAGPLAGTELLLSLGLRWTLAIDSLTFLASAILLAQVRLPRAAAAPDAGKVSAIDDIRSGWRYLQTHDRALHLSALLFISLLCAGVWTPLAPFFIRDHLGGSARLLGWQFAAFGAGAVAGSVLAPAAIARFGRGAALFAGLIAEGLCQTAYAVVLMAPLSTGLMGLWGIGVSLIVVSFYSILQTVVDERFFGRVFSTVRQSEHVALALAMGVSVLLKESMDSRSILLGGGVMYCSLALAACATSGGRRLLATR